MENNPEKNISEPEENKNNTIQESDLSAPEKTENGMQTAEDTTAEADQSTSEADERALIPVQPEPHYELMEVETAAEKTPEEIMDEKADKVIAAATAAAAATCALPIPFADAPILIGEQAGMMASLAGIYHIDLKKNALRSIVLAVLGVSGTTVLGKTIFTSLIKLIPGVGSVAGGTIAAATGGSLTAALGKAWQLLCKDVLGGKMDAEDLTSKEGIKLLTTALKDQLRLEMTHQEEEDVLTSAEIPADEDVLITPYPGQSAEDEVIVTPYTPADQTEESQMDSQTAAAEQKQISDEDQAGAEIQSQIMNDETSIHPGRHATSQPASRTDGVRTMKHARETED